MTFETIAWIAELEASYVDGSWSELDHDPDDRWASGLFSAHIDGSALVDGPDAVPIEDALAWARERAERIVVRVDRHGEQEFSAGREPVGSLPPWPPADYVPVRRRAAGSEYMDRTTDDEPIAWAVLIVVQRGWGPIPGGTARAFADAIAAVAGGAVTETVDPGPGPWEQPQPRGWTAHPGVNGRLGFGELARSRFTVQAATRDDAWRTARAHGEAALDRACESVGLPRTTGGSPPRDIVEHGCDLDSIVVYPEGSHLARWNCSLELDGPDPAAERG